MGVERCFLLVRGDHDRACASMRDRGGGRGRGDPVRFSHTARLRRTRVSVVLVRFLLGSRAPAKSSPALSCDWSAVSGSYISAVACCTNGCRLVRFLF